jgi:hypothetical protein
MRGMNKNIDKIFIKDHIVAAEYLNIRDDVSLKRIWSTTDKQRTKMKTITKYSIK